MAALLLDDTASRQRLIAGAYHSTGDDGTGLLARAFSAVLAAAPAEMAVRNALKTVPSPANVEQVSQKAVAAGVITEQQAAELIKAQQLVARVIAVDEFTPQEMGGKQALRPPAAKAG